MTAGERVGQTASRVDFALMFGARSLVHRGQVGGELYENAALSLRLYDFPNIEGGPLRQIGFRMWVISTDRRRTLVGEEVSRVLDLVLSDE